MHPTKFQLNPNYPSGADAISRFSNWPPLQLSEVLEWKEFSNSNSPCHLNASDQVWAQSDLSFGSRRDLKIFQDGHCGSHLGYWNGPILAILNLYVVSMPSIKFQLYPTYSLGDDDV